MLENIEKIKTVKLILERKISFITIQLFVVVSFFIRVFSIVGSFNTKFIDLLLNNKYLIINNGIFFLITDIVLSLVWLFYRRIPKFKNEDVGVLFAIRTDNEEVREKIKKDFIEAIQKEIIDAYDKIKIVILSEYHSEKIDNDRKLLKYYHKISKAKFILHGVARNRKNKGKDNYFIELNESISHKPISDNLRKELIQDMISVFPRSSLIPVDEEFSGFNLNSRLFTYGSLYILGLSCLYSGRPDVAYRLHKKAYAIKINSNIEILKISFERIRGNIRKILIDELSYFARKEYINECDITKIGEFLKEAQIISHNNYNLLAFEAIYYFLIRDFTKSYESLGRAKKVSDGNFTWAYSRAFLHAYEGDLIKAYTNYKIGFRNNAGINVHIQVEEFIRKILLEEPEKYQLHYCLGLVYFFDHNDMELAEEEFRIFLKSDKEKQKYLNIHKYVRKYLDEIVNIVDDCKWN